MDFLNCIGADSKDTEIVNERLKVTDVYICVFFDGTGNNLYEQFNKGKHLNELRKIVVDEKKNSQKESTAVSFSLKPLLFTKINSINELRNNIDLLKNKELDSVMDCYELQRVQAEKELTINAKRGDKETQEISDNGGVKYSNIAILRSLVGKNRLINTGKKCALVYNLYIEGSGKHWDKEKKTNMRESGVGLGMGTGRTGVVGLVSKAVVFVRERLLCIGGLDKKNVQLHFAIFGFSRGATCGRLFSSLIVKGDNCIGHEKEFERYLPNNNEYYDANNNRVSFLDDFSNKDVDFLGIFDTVSSIGLLQKKDNSTNYDWNNYKQTPDSSQDGWYSNALENSRAMGGIMMGSAGWKDAKGNYHRFNVRNYGLDPYRYSDKIKHTFHICAIDEFRENFALVDLGDNMEKNHCTEVYLPGCHSDIGGGYMYNDTIDEHLIRKVIGEKEIPTCMITSMDPRVFKKSVNLSGKVLNDLGWLNIDERTSESMQKYKEAMELKEEMQRQMIKSGMIPIVPNNMDPKRYVEKIEDWNENIMGQTTFFNETKTEITFRHFVQEGYSNITLKMMLDRAEGNYGLANWGEFYPFSKKGTIPERFKIKDCDILNGIKDKCDIVINESEGKRYWIIPDEKEYVKLRKNYLHFSCTDIVLNTNQPADMGNAPNWTSEVLLKGDEYESLKNETPQYYILCRLVYRGNEDDVDLHYWNEKEFKEDKVL